MPTWHHYKMVGTAKRKQRERDGLPAPDKKAHIPWYIRAENKIRQRGAVANAEMSQKEFARTVALEERIAQARERRATACRLRLLKKHTTVCTDMSVDSTGSQELSRYHSLQLNICETTNTIDWLRAPEETLSAQELDAVAIRQRLVTITNGIELDYTGNCQYSMCFEAPVRKRMPRRYFSVRDVYDMVLKYERATRQFSTYEGSKPDREHLVFNGLYVPPSATKDNTFTILSIAWGSKIN